MAQTEGKQTSLSRKKGGFTVQASPFNGVKLDLALIVLMGVVVWMIQDRVTSNELGQFLLLAGYGVVAALWIVIRTRRVLSKHAVRQESDLDG